MYLSQFNLYEDCYLEERFCNNREPNYDEDTEEQRDRWHFMYSDLDNSEVDDISDDTSEIDEEEYVSRLINEETASLINDISTEDFLRKKSEAQEETKRFSYFITNSRYKEHYLSYAWAEGTLTLMLMKLRKNFINTGTCRLKEIDDMLSGHNIKEDHNFNQSNEK